MLFITNTNLYYKEYSTSDKKELLDDSDFIYHLSDYVVFDDDLTFERIFNLIIQHRKIINIVFSTALGHYKIEDYINDFKQESKYPKTYHLEISTLSDYYQNELLIRYDFGGFDDAKNIAYSLSLCSISDYKYCKIRIDDEFEIYDFVDEDFKSILKTKYSHIRLFDVIYAILDEITFYGTSDDKTELSDIISERGQVIEQAIEDGTINEITVPYEQIKIELNEKLIEDYIVDEDYENAERLRKENEELKKIIKEKNK